MTIFLSPLARVLYVAAIVVGTCPFSLNAQQPSASGLGVARPVDASPRSKFTLPPDARVEFAKQDQPRATTPRKKNRKLVWILVGAGAAAGVVAAVVAGGGGGNDAPAPSPGATITLGPPTIGAPQ